MYHQDEYFNSVSRIRAKLIDDYGEDVKPWKIMHIMQHNMGMRYKKVKEISYQANSPKNLILRQ